MARIVLIGESWRQRQNIMKQNGCYITQNTCLICRVCFGCPISKLHAVARRQGEIGTMPLKPRLVHADVFDGTQA